MMSHTQITLMRTRLADVSFQLGRNHEQLVLDGKMRPHDSLRIMRLIRRFSNDVDKVAREPHADIKRIAAVVNKFASFVVRWYTMRRAVFESCENAIANEYDIDQWTAAEVVQDLLDCDAQFEEMNAGELDVAPHVRSWLDVRMHRRARDSAFAVPPTSLAN